jgi:hypothetical protein
MDLAKSGLVWKQVLKQCKSSVDVISTVKIPNSATVWSIHIVPFLIEKNIIPCLKSFPRY